jgi:hypothetical protein
LQFGFRIGHEAFQPREKFRRFCLGEFARHVCSIMLFAQNANLLCWMERREAPERRKFFLLSRARSRIIMKL